MTSKPPFTFPKDVISTPFPIPWLNGFITFHTVTRNKVAFIVEWANIYQWPNGYYVENPKTKQKLLEWDNDTIQKFIDTMSADIIAVVDWLDKTSYSDDYVKRKLPERIINAVINAAKKTMS